MRHFKTIAVAALLLNGCGVVENMARNCNGDEFCMFVFGRDVSEGEAKDKEQDAAIKEFRGQLKAVQDQQEMLLYMINSLSNMVGGQVQDLRDDVTLLAQGLSTLQGSMVNGYYSKTQIDSFISTINGDIQSFMSQLAVLQGYDTVTQIVSPCGITTGYYEVLLRTAQGHIIAYFEKDGQRYLTPLAAGTYSTTDGRGCTFTLQPGGSIVGSSVVQ